VFALRGELEGWAKAVLTSLFARGRVQHSGFQEQAETSRRGRTRVELFRS